MKKIKFLFGVIAIIALTGSLLVACDSSSGTGIAGNDDSAASGWGGGKKPGGGGGGGGKLPSSSPEITITGGTLVLFIGGAPTPQTRDISGTALTEGITIESNDDGIEVTPETLPKTGGTINIAFSAAVTHADGYATITISSKGAESKTIKVYTFDSITNDTFIVDPNTPISALVASLGPFYDNDDLAAIFADIKFILNSDEIKANISADGIKLGYSDVEFSANPFAAAAAQSPAFTISIPGVTLTEDISIAENALGEIFEDKVYALVIETDTVKTDVFQGIIKPDLGSMAFSAYWLNPRVEGRTKVTAAGPYQGKGLESFATLAAFEDAGGSWEISDASDSVLNLGSGSLSDTETAETYKITFSYEGENAVSAASLALWLIKADTLVVTPASKKVVVPKDTSNKSTLIPADILAGTTVKVAYDDGNGADYKSGALVDITASLILGDLDDSGETYINGGTVKFTVASLNGIAVSAAVSGTKDFFQIEIGN